MLKTNAKSVTRRRRATETQRRICGAIIFAWLFMLSFGTGIALAQETPTPTLTPIPDEYIITTVLMPFTMEVEDTEISGVLPAEWDMIQAGTAIRNDNDGINATYILHLFMPDTTINEAIEPLLAPLELEALPDKEFMTYESQQFTWTIYIVRYEPPQLEGDILQVTLATAEADEGTYIIVLQTYPQEFAGLYLRVFEPAMDTFGLPLADIDTYLSTPEFITVEIEEFNIAADIPIRWQNVNPGAYMRGTDETDFTTLLIQTSPDLGEREFANLLRERLRIPTELPEIGEMLALANFNWTVYRMDFEAQGAAVTLHIATVSDEERTIMIALLSLTDEADTLLQTILLPILSNIKV
jgi:hypothetical protein